MIHLLLLMFCCSIAVSGVPLHRFNRPIYLVLSGVVAKIGGSISHENLSNLNDAKDVQSCGEGYGYWRGRLSSNKPKTIKDTDTGIEFDVVCMGKKVYNVYDIDTGTSKKEVEDELITETEMQYYGDVTLSISAESSGKKYTSVFTNSPKEVRLCAGMHQYIPTRHIFSNMKNAVINIIDTSISSKKVPSKSLVGQRLDIYGATLDSEFTVIGDIMIDSQRKWAVMPSEKYTTITDLTFHDFKRKEAMQADILDKIGNGLLIFGSVLSIGYVTQIIE